MINTKILKICEVVLNRLHIKYHEHQLLNSVIFFCWFSDGRSFDMMVHPDGTIRLWKFIKSDMPKENIGFQYIYTKSEQIGTVVGYEVTNERDLNCYAEQTIDILGRNAELRITKQLKGFSNLINEPLWCK